MKTKVLQVFYNENGLPFKDQGRTVHFPVIGSGFMGASNTTQIKFYFKEIGDDAVKYVAVSKLPNGKVGSKVLENYFDSELNEPYALLELDSYYTQYKGDLFISLQGYQGGVQVNYNEDTELYEIEGTPTIQATGSIKFTNNYATQFVGSGEEQNITLQQLLAIISDTVLRHYVNSNSTLAEVFNEIGTKICAVDIEGDEYLCEMSGDTNIVIYDIHNQEWYAFSGANTTTIDTVLSDQYKHTIASKEYVDDNVFEMPSSPMTLTQSQVDYLTKNNVRIKHGGYLFENAFIDNDGDHIYVCAFMQTFYSSSDTAINFSFVVLNTVNMTLTYNSNNLLIYDKAQADDKFATKQELEDFGNLFTYKGTASVSEINALTNIGNGWCYNLTDSGTLTLGNLQVEQGDNVAFDGTVWTKLSSETVLGNYYTKQEGQEFENDIDNRVDAIENQVQQVASGSPKGVYARLSDLETAYPTGAEGIYVVSGTGHWYYWNGSAWTDGGAYQSSVGVVPETRKIAGIDLVDDISKQELEEALGVEDYEYISSYVLSFTGGNLQQNSKMALIDLNGQLSDQTQTSRCSDFIKLNKGETIVFNGAIGSTRAAIAVYSSPSYDSFVSSIAGINAVELEEYSYAATNDCYVVCSSTDYYTSNNFEGTNYEIHNEKYLLSLNASFVATALENKVFRAFGRKKGFFWITNNSTFSSYVTFLDGNTEVAYILAKPNDKIEYFVNNEFDNVRITPQSSGQVDINVEELGTEFSNIETTNDAIGKYIFHLNYSPQQYFDPIFNISDTAGKYTIINKGTQDIYIDFYEEGQTSSFMYVLIHPSEKLNINVVNDFAKIKVSGASGDVYIDIIKNGIEQTLEKVAKLTETNLSYWTKKYEPELPFGTFNFVKKIYEDENGYPGLGYDIVYDEANNRYVLFRALFDVNLNYAKVVSSYSADLENWSSDTDVLLPTGQDGDADKGSITFPQLLKYGNEWIMYYVGFDQVGFERGKHSICYATSKDLTTWTRHGAILTVQNFIDDWVWDSSKLSTGVIYRPKVVNLNGKYYMFINGGPDGDASIGGPDENIYLCESDSPIDNWKVIKEIITAADVFPNSNYQICSDPDIIGNGNNFVMAFWGDGGIKFATARNCDFPSTWKVFDGLLSGTTRPLFIPTKDFLFLLTNTDGAHSISLYKAYWKDYK